MAIVDDNELARIKELATKTLNRNRRYKKLLDKTKISYTVPCRGYYNNQYLWDSCFHSISLVHIDINRARDELTSLISSIETNGFMPILTYSFDWRHLCQSVFDLFTKYLLYLGKNPRITQPPILGMTIENYYNKTKDITFIKNNINLVIKNIEWYAKYRDHDNDGLLSIIHPWESGIDSITSYDESLKINPTHTNKFKIYFPLILLLIKYRLLNWNHNKIINSKLFNIESVMFNCIYVKSLESISRLSKIIGDEFNTHKYAQLADKIHQRIEDKLYDANDQIYYDYNCITNSLIKKITISSLFPIINYKTNKQRVITLCKRYLFNKDMFYTAYPIPSIPINSQEFNPSGNKFVLWRGPSWVNANWFIYKGLAEHNLIAEAKDILERTINMISKNDLLYEFYNPYGANGYGARNFSWSTLALDMIAEPINSEPAGIRTQDTLLKRQML